jgi:NAD(P)-dependent dehydrogenase (short-subunit alcohol dehydrogenase family)
MCEPPPDILSAFAARVDFSALALPKFCKPPIFVYRASAVVGLSESPNFELAPFNIRVSVVAPGGASTDFAGRSLATTFQNNDHPYAETVGKTIAVFGRNRGRQIRYVLGEDAVAMAAARAKMSDEQYPGYIEGWMAGT